jgi:hypothetical protein
MTVDLEKLVAVSSVNGVLRLVATKNNGLVLEDIDTNKKRFYSSRKYNFTPLESIAIYVNTDEESVPLGEVFGIMKDQVETNPTISIKSDAEELKTYFEKVLSNYNKEQVYVSDIKKVIKWFDFMSERDLLNEKIETEEEVETTDLEEAAAE